MRHPALFAAAGLASLVALGGCVVPDDRYAYDTRYDRPYHDRYAYYYDRPSYYYAPRHSDWNYSTNTWRASRWDSRWSDRYRRNWDGFDRP